MENLNNLLSKADLVLLAKSIVFKKNIKIYFFDEFLTIQNDIKNINNLEKINYSEIDEIVILRMNHKKTNNRISLNIYKKNFDSEDFFIDLNENNKFEKYLKKNKKIRQITFDKNKEDRESEKNRKNNKQKKQISSNRFEVITWLFGVFLIGMMMLSGFLFKENIIYIVPIFMPIFFAYMYYVTVLRIKRKK